MSEIRLRPNDCLSEWFRDLRAQGRTVRPYDADAREQWLTACGDVLAQVPNDEQRTSWALFLAYDLRLPGCPVNFLAGLLLSKAAEVKRCGV